MSSILFLAHRIPYPPNRGDRIRSYHLLKFLAERADVHLAFLTDESVSEKNQTVLDDLCTRVTHARLHPQRRWLSGARSLATGGTATVGLFYSRQLKKTIADWSSETRFDVAFVFCSSMVQYLHTKGLRQVPSVVDLVDVDSQKWFDYADQASGPKRWLLNLEGRRLRRLESSLPDLTEAVTVVTPQEADVFQAFCPDYRPHVLRNGVDLEYFQPVKEAIAPGPPSAVFVGALDYEANVDGARWFCHQIWPQVRQQFPDAVFRLVGSRPNAEARLLGNLPGVELIGQVPDVRPYLHEATVVTVPLRVARGVQNKVLEGLAVGKPVLVTPQGLEGIEATPDTHLICAATPDEWTSRLSTLFEDADLCKQLASKGREFVEREYRWASQLKTLNDLPGLGRCLESSTDNLTTPAKNCSPEIV